VGTLRRVVFDPDTTPPSVPTGLTATPISSSRIDLSWAASTDTGGSALAGYELLRNSATTIPIGVQTSYSDTGLTASTLYSYRVRARDGNNNYSAYANSVSATTQAGSSSQLYSWDALTPFAYVDPAKTASGTGTLSDPLNPTQAISVGPAASGDRVIIWLPGDYNISAVNAAGRRFAALVPQNGASSTRRVIHKAQNPGSTVAGLRTRIRRTSGAGVIFGFLNSSDAIWDGFMCDTKSGDAETVAAGGSGETGQASAWNSTRCKFIRCDFDSQYATYDDGDRNCIFVHTCSDVEIGDCRFTKIGPSSGQASVSNITLLMWYNSDGIEVHHCEFSLCPTAIWCKGQTAAGSVFNHRYHHNVFHECGVAIRVSSPIQTSLANYVRSYQNIIYNCQFGLVASNFNVNEPAGIAFVNNVVANGTERHTGAFSTTHAGMMCYGSAGAFQDGHVIYRNNAIVNVYTGNYTYDDGSQIDRARWDRNSYFGFTTISRHSEGTNMNLSTWQGKTPARDAAVLTSDPLFVNSSANDFRLQAGSPLRSFGTDFLSLLGGSSSASINVGPYITSDMSDQIGPRS
jgi:hypothetical protein